MSPELAHLIKVQQLDSEVEARRRTLVELPQVLQALDARLAARQTAVDEAKARLTENQAARRNLEKELAVVQARLTKFKDQLNEVKTNKEYTAMQHEITMAQDGVRGFEDQILELMVQADEVNGIIKAADGALAEEKAKVGAERTQRESDAKRVDKEIAELQRARDDERKKLSAEASRLFDHIAKARKGSSVAEVRDGVCMSCHVRLRPQIYNDVRKGDKLIQCESCTRILYVLPPKPAEANAAPAPGAAPA